MTSIKTAVIISVTFSFNCCLSKSTGKSQLKIFSLKKVYCLDKEDTVYTHTDTHSVILLSHKKEQNFAICDNTDTCEEHYAQ